MSNLKDTDIDDLIRRASDKYPLRTDSANWDRMAGALDKEPPPTYGSETEEKRKRRFLWLFLLLPLLGGVGYFTWHHTGRSMSAASVPVSGRANGAGASAATGANDAAGANDANGASAAGSTAANAAGANGADAHTATGANGVNGADVHAAGANDAAKVNEGSKAATGANAGNRVSAGNAATDANHVAGTNVSTGVNAAAGTSASSGVNTSAGTNAATAANHGRGRASGNRFGDANRRIKDSRTANGGRIMNDGKMANEATNNADGAIIDGAIVDGNGSMNGGKGSLSLASAPGQDRLFFDLQRAYIPRDYQLQVDVTAPETPKDTAKQKSPSKKKSYLYAGVLGAPDLSTVKMQSVKGVGTTFGILLGYAFNDRWSVESGVYVDRKKYYTDGEYFDTKGVKLPYPNVDLLNVNGTCYMWEIPLNVRYNFNPDGKTKWFATAGLSTYLMTKENYSYAWKWYGSSNVWDSAWNIKKPSQYPFSIINLSAGFEQRLGKVGNLRIEPYVRIPLGGVGTGKLPIMSGGINIGITRRLW